MLGTFVNTAAVIAGSLIGILVKKGIPKRFADTIMKGLGLCVLYIGISGALKGTNTLIAILSITIGAVIGELVDLDKSINNIGRYIESKFTHADGQSQSTVAEGFVTASMLFCVGAMAIVGSLQSGLAQNHETLFIKSLLDFVSAIIFASTLGIGVIFSAVFVLIYQGTITLLAQWVSPLLSDAAVAEMTCTGSILIIGLALNMLGLTKLKIINYLPALFIPPVLCLFM